MRTTPTLPAIAGLLLCVATTFAAAPARAQMVQELSMATDRCQPTLAIHDEAFRKRPLGMVNESSQTVFATCGFSGGFMASRLIGLVEIGLRNGGTVPVTVQCTLVDAQGGAGAPRYIAGTSVQFLPGAGASVWWGPEHNGDEMFIYPSVSCALPPGVAIEYAASRYALDVI